MPDNEINKLVDSIPTKKIALHGKGETWSPVAPDYDPYKTSPLVNNQGPQFGGEYRRNLPGSGGEDTMDRGLGDSNEKKDPTLQKNRISDVIDEIKGPTYVVRLRLSEEEEPSEEKAREIFGPEGLSDGKSIYVEVHGFENAVKMRDKFRDAIIEPKGM